MNTWRSPRTELRRLSAQWGRSCAGRHLWRGSGTELTYHRQIPPRPAPPVIHTTLHHTAVRFCQIHHRHILYQTNTRHFLHTDAFLLLMPPQQREPRVTEADLSRPSRAAQRLLRLFSIESARKQLRPFYSTIVRSVLQEEQDRYKSRPTQAISLIWNLFGRRQAFRTLTRFYMSAVEKLGSNYYPALHGQNALYLAAGVVLHSQVYRRYVRQFRNREAADISMHYVRPQQSISDDTLRSETAQRILPVRETTAELGRTVRNDQSAPVPDQMREVRLNEADFQALVQRVASSLSHQTRLEALRKGGS